MIDVFFNKEYWVVDFLPKQVPEKAGGRFFSVEEYFLESSRYIVLRERFSDILLKLYCYYDIQLFIDDDTEGIFNPEPELLASHIKDNQGDLSILIGTSEGLFTINRDDTHMTVYGPSEELLDLVRALANAVGLFLWKPSVRSVRSDLQSDRFDPADL